MDGPPTGDGLSQENFKQTEEVRLDLNTEPEKSVREKVERNNESTPETVNETGEEEAPPPEEIANQVATVGEIDNQDCEYHPRKDEVIQEDDQKSPTCHLYRRERQ